MVFSPVDGPGSEKPGNQVSGGLFSRRLAFGVAHDYKNMLGVILGYAELVLEDLDPPEQSDAFLKKGSGKKVQQVLHH